LSIVVSATSGHLGRLIVEDLLDRGVPATDVVAGARSLDAIKGLTEAGVRTAVSTTTTPAPWRARSPGATRLCSSPATT
jgi:NAD(P)H dehydrogenase (quinone)